MTRKMVLRWVALILLVVVLGVVFIQLGEWQLRRLDERRAQNAVVAEHSQQDPVPYETVMTDEITEGDEWQPVEVTGTYSEHTYQVRYRNQGSAGTEVVSVLEADDGRLVLVNRGFIPRPPGSPDPTPPKPPSGEVTVTGWVLGNEHDSGNATVPHDYTVRLINSDDIGESLGVELVNGYIGATDSTPADDAQLEPIALPELDEGPHESYAWQWFSFTVIAVVGVAVLIRADIRDRKKAQKRRERRAAAQAKKAAEADNAQAREAPHHQDKA